MTPAEKEISPGRLEKFRIPAAFFLVLFLEVFLFNFRFWQSGAYVPTEILINPENCIGLYSAEENGEFIFYNEEKQICAVWIDVDEAGGPIHNIAVSLRSDYSNTEQHFLMSPISIPVATNMVQLHITSIDEEERYHTLPLRYSGRNREKRDIFAVPEDEHRKLLLLQFEPMREKDNLPIVLSGISVNEPVPFSFNVLRVFLLLGMSIFFITLGPSSFLWSKKALGDDGKVRDSLMTGFLIFLVLATVCFAVLVKLNIVYSSDREVRPFYNDLAHALAHGSVALDLEADPLLAGLEDPYRVEERAASGASWLLDYAYYEGKYYTYFGVIPCLVFYLPAWMIFETDILSWQVLCILCPVFLLGVFFLLSELVRRYRPEISVALFVIAYILMICGISLPGIAANSTTYHVPMMSGVILFVYGMAFYLKALSSGQDPYFVLGSLCMALIAGCRPQLLIAVAVAVPLLINGGKVAAETRDRRGLLRKGMCLVIPYAVVAILLMGYNYARFGSITQFGAVYNLTVDPVRNEIHFENAGKGLQYYLFRIVPFSGSFPFVSFSALEWENPFRFANQESGNGLFLLYPILFLGFLAFLRRGTTEREKEVLWLSRCLFLAGLCLVVIDAGMVGMIGRYRLDFSVLFVLAAVLMLLVFRPKFTGKYKKPLTVLLAVLTAVSVINGMMTYFTPQGMGDIKEENQIFYADMAHMIEFWW